MQLIVQYSTTVTSYVKSMGNMNPELRTKIVRDLWNKAVSINSWLSITQVPGILNTESDIVSHFWKKEWNGKFIQKMSKWYWNTTNWLHLSTCLQVG